MRRADIPFAVRLTSVEGWGIPPRDFQRILQLDPRGSFVAVESGGRVGLTTTTSYRRRIAWIGNVVVQNKHRGKHIGERLIQHAIRYLNQSRVRRIALYCFKENVPFYRRLGFVSGARFARLRLDRPSTHVGTDDSPVNGQLGESELLEMDRRAFGADRGQLIRLLLHSGRAWYLASGDGRSHGYALVKRYTDMNEIGPWVSFGSSSNKLDGMLAQLLATSGRKPVEITCPLSSTTLSRILRKHGFRRLNDGHLMFYCRRSEIGRPEAVLAYGFLDKG